MLRIIAGTHKGRRLLAPPGLETRPILDRIKQSMFDWLGQTCTGLHVADVCAGSGSVGFEAFSRGAASVHLIESGRHALSVLQANHRSVGSPTAVRIHSRPFQSVLPALKDLDLIFCDPPFPWFVENVDTLTEMMSLTAQSLASKGRLIIRGERGQDLPQIPRTLREADRRLYGRSWVALFVRVPLLTM